MASPASWVDFVEEIERGPLTLKEIEEWIAEFQYQGFDPVTILKSIWERGQKAGKSKAEIIKDVQGMIVLHLTRGNKVEKMKKKMSEAGQKALQVLISAYGIKEKAVNATDLTLSRVAIVNAGLTCSLLEFVQQHMAVTLTEMERDSPGYPVHMMHGSFASMIDLTLPDATSKDIIDAHQLYLVRFAQKINPASRSKTFKQIVEDNKQTLKAAMSSTFISNKVKLDHLKKWGIVDQHSVVSDETKEAAKVFRKLLGAA
ncbi:nucleoprotein [Komandory virus]|uniref:Nucleoprotein n=1 Tax=Rukutama virus TaxID=1531287 RepID=A0A076JQF4_9VIRU|nr:nucleoprotein [Rukutama virus]AII79357.1 nucleoprotein [Komandory virus]AII79359.1 nucleoprotein [Rukutama virus]